MIVKRIWAIASVAIMIALLVPLHFTRTGASELDAFASEEESRGTLPFAAKEVLWLARAVQSETNRRDEMNLVAWTIRNRVESGYRGTTYEEVVLAPNQFSGLNVYDTRYRENISLDHEDQNPVWRQALEVAEAVYSAPASLNPLPANVRHFYSPRSARVKPTWAALGEPVLSIRDSSSGSIRFAFYANVK